MDDLAALRLQFEWGADEALEEAPVDRLRAAPPPPSVRSAAQPPAPRERAPNTPSPAERGRVGEGAPPTRATPAERALQAATGARSLPALRDAIASFDGCALRDTAGHLVFAEGDPAADLLLIGDPPGAAEDRSGTPFAGPAGALLDQMLASVGLGRSELLLAPLIPWRPPGDRPPSAAELAICLPFLARLVALSEPRRLVLFGPLAARAILAPSRRRPRGTWVEGAFSTIAPAPTRRARHGTPPSRSSSGMARSGQASTCQITCRR